MMTRSDNLTDNHEAGFTLIELILAMALFSFIFLIIVAGFLNVIHLHEAAVATRNTQHNSRFGMEDIVRDARPAYAATVITGSPTADYDVICLKSTVLRRYYVDLTSRALVTDTANNCTDALVPGSGQAVTTSDVKVAYLKATASAGSPPFLELRIGITSANSTSILTSGGESCDPALGANQFCAVTGLQTTVSLRGQKETP